MFHSPAEDLLVYAADLPFSVVGDPGKLLFAEFGAESSVGALLDPRVWRFIPAGVTHSAFAILAGEESVPALKPSGGRLGLPADVLIGRTGRVLACKYGVHAHDQWSVDDLLSFACAPVPATRGPLSAESGTCLQA